MHPGHRRQGIATALLEAAERRFTELGGRRGDAMLLERNEPAQHAWSAAGYAREPQWRRWTKPLPRPREQMGRRNTAPPVHAAYKSRPAPSAPLPS